MTSKVSEKEQLEGGSKAQLKKTERQEGGEEAAAPNEHVDQADIVLTTRGAKQTEGDLMVEKDNHQKSKVLEPKAGHDKTKGHGPPGPGRPGGFQQKEEKIGFLELFKYSSCGQKSVVWLGLLSSVISGAASPTIAVVMGEIIAIFDPGNSKEEVQDGIIQLFQHIAILCAVMWLFGYLQYACMQAAAERLSFDLRTLYLRALLSQETEYFENQTVESIPSQISEYFQAIGDGVGEKFGQLVYSFAMLASGLAIGFWKGPFFCLICLTYLPIMATIFIVFGGLLRKKMFEKLRQSKQLGAHTEEILSAIKLVVSFAQEDYAIKKYDKIAQETLRVCKRASIQQSVMIGLFLTFMFGFYLYSYVIGSILIRDGRINPATDEVYSVVEIIQVSQATMISMMTFSSITPIIPAIVKALVVGKQIFKVIEREPLIRSPKQSQTGHSNISIEEGITFDNVSFRYPKALESSGDLFKELSFKIKPFTSTAIVGPSGSGKSTIVQLLNRFYDPKEGQIRFGSTDLKAVDLVTLRSMIGYVSQEPVLILGTIRDNLAYGNREASEEDMRSALKRADAGFVFELETQLDTYVGSGSVQNLSGGQKQRIAIARALIKNPEILVLDEATSALDPKSEAEVQDAIAKIQEDQSQKITVIMIAHRLSTIQTAEHLLFLEEQNRVVSCQQGTPEYTRVMNKLQSTNYAHQENDEQTSNLEQDDQFGSTNTKKPARQKSLLSQMSLSLKDSGNRESLRSTQSEAIDERRQSSRGSGWCRILSYYHPRIFAVLMLLTAAVRSMAFPLLGLVVSKVQMVLLGSATNPDWFSEMSEIQWFWLLLCLVLGSFTLVEKLMFGITGENLTYNVRKELMRGILYKQVQWFDREDRASGILTSVLSEDVCALNGMTTEVISTLMEAALGIFLGLLVSMFFAWRMALLTVACSPVMLVGVVAMSRLQWGNRRGRTKADRESSGVDDYAKANALLSDVIVNYRTVISFGQKNVEGIIGRFQEYLQEPRRKKVRNAHIGGFFFGYSNCARMVFLGLVFYIGSWLVQEGYAEADEIYMSIWVLFSTFMGAGIAMSNVPSVSKAKASAKNIFQIIDEKSTLDVRQQQAGQQTIVKSGEIAFKDVTFSYPARSAAVLQNFNMHIPATQKIALVGHSGCGKSTITNLLLRFYNIKSGNIQIDGVDIEDYDVRALRRQIGFVMQEPVLFNTSIKENILYGDLEASDEQILKVAELANALSFIESNIEDLEKDQRQERNAEDLRDLFGKLCERRPGLKALDIASLDDSETNMMLLVLQKADTTALNAIEAHAQAFMAYLQTHCKISGTKWDDLILSFEWDCEVNSLLEGGEITDEVKEEVRRAMESHKQLFNRLTVLNWLKDNAQADAGEARPLVESIEANQQAVIEQHSYRFQELHTSVIDKMRDSDGNIKLSEGFEKNCGLKGSKLSGGQKQRIAIARAVIKDPKILILDEATSALDEQSQEVVQQALDRAMEGRTAIVIAHRLSTIRNCQLLFVINDGVIVESGTYEELSSNSDSHFNKLKSGMEM